MSVAQRRQFPRYPFHAEVEIEWGSEVLRSPTTDISLGGMFVQTGSPLWVGASFSAQVLLEEPLRVDCVVRRVVPGQGMGLAFAPLTDQAQARLEKLVTRLGGLAGQ